MGVLIVINFIRVDLKINQICQLVYLIVKFLFRKVLVFIERDKIVIEVNEYVNLCFQNIYLFNGRLFSGENKLLNCDKKIINKYVNFVKKFKGSIYIYFGENKY